MGLELSSIKKIPVGGILQEQVNPRSGLPRVASELTHLIKLPCSIEDVL